MSPDDLSFDAEADDDFVDHETDETTDKANHDLVDDEQIEEEFILVFCEVCSNSSSFHASEVGTTQNCLQCGEPLEVYEHIERKLDLECEEDFDKALITTKLVWYVEFIAGYYFYILFGAAVCFVLLALLINAFQ